MTVSLLSTKLHVPRPRVNGVVRPRLTEKLIAALDRPGQLILISAPAGFGKTTLLAELAAEKKKTIAWISLGDGDNDPNRFWSYVIAACRSVQPEAGEAALALLQTPQSLADETIHIWHAHHPHADAPDGNPVAGRRPVLFPQGRAGNKHGRRHGRCHSHRGCSQEISSALIGCSWLQLLA